MASPALVRLPPETPARPVAPAIIPSLYGIRALSVALVLIGHIYGTSGSPVPDVRPFLGNYADLGVQVFFCLSGFLITTLMMAERENHGGVSLKAFYWRRAVRIFPAAYVFLLCIAIAGLASGTDLLVGALYLSNMSPDRPWMLAHLWSLAVEEQFYLLWPFAFVYLRERAVWALAGVVALAPVARFVAFRVGGDGLLLVFPCVADSLAFGCLLAVLRTRLHANSWYLRLRDLPLAVLVLAVILVNAARYHAFSAMYLANSVLAFLIAVTIDRCIVHHNTGAGRLLNSRPLVWVGAISYSLYLWQQPFLNRHSAEWAAAFPVNIVLAVLAATTSYYVIERPAMKLRNASLRKRQPDATPLPTVPPRQSAYFAGAGADELKRPSASGFHPAGLTTLNPALDVRERHVYLIKKG